jgi:hypothetical protein
MSKNKSATFYISSIQNILYCNLVLYVVGRCDSNFSFVGAIYIYQSNLFSLGIGTIHKDLGLTHYIGTYYYLKDLNHVHFAC